MLVSVTERTFEVWITKSSGRHQETDIAPVSNRVGDSCVLAACWDYCCHGRNRIDNGAGVYHDDDYYWLHFAGADCLHRYRDDCRESIRHLKRAARSDSGADASNVIA